MEGPSLELGGCWEDRRTWPPSPGPCCSFPRSLCLPCPVRRAASPADLMSPVLAQEQAGLLPWATVASAMGSSPPGVSAAFLAGPLGRAQTDPPQGNEFSSGTSSICWGWPSTRTQLCLSLSARTATPSSTSATASSSPSCRESTSPRQAPGRLARSRRPSFIHLVGVRGLSSLHAGECRGRGLCSGETHGAWRSKRAGVRELDRHAWGRVEWKETGGGPWKRPSGLHVGEAAYERDLVSVLFAASLTPGRADPLQGWCQAPTRGRGGSVFG